MRPFLLSLIAALALAASGPAQAAPRALATIKPVHSLVAAVMDGVGTPDLLITGAASEHSYALKPSDAGKLSRAQIIFWIGPDLETYLIGPFASLASSARTIDLEHARGVRLLPARHGGLWEPVPDTHGPTDPHIWLDPQNAIAMVAAIAQTLSNADPVNAARYTANAARETSLIQFLDARVARQLAPVRNRPYIVFHDAYHYFEAHYGLAAIGTVTVAPDRPVSPRRVEQLHDALLQGKAVCIFREPQFTPELVNSIAEGSPARMGVLDPLGADLTPGPALYPTLLTRLSGALVRCLSR